MHEARYRSLSLSTPTTTTLLTNQSTAGLDADAEHSNLAQLRAHVLVLVLYLAAWSAAALSVARPLSDRLQRDEELFAGVFALCSCALGVFLVLFYAVARRDVRDQWRQLSCRNCGRGCRCCRSRSVCDMRTRYGAGASSNGGDQLGRAPILYQHHLQQMYQQQQQQQRFGTLPSITRSDSNSQSSRNRQMGGRLSANSNSLKGVVAAAAATAGAELNGHGTLDSSYRQAAGGLKAGNVNLVQLHRQQFVHNGGGGGSSGGTVMSAGIHGAGGGAGSGAEEAFYNPNQFNVARKFFKKQKRLQKRNNFEYHRQQRDQQQQQNNGGGGAVANNDDCRSEVSSIVSYPRPRQPSGGGGGGLAMFASSEASKVNNTNIHVDLRAAGRGGAGGAGGAGGMMPSSSLAAGQQLIATGGGGGSEATKEPARNANNPNMLSDSCNESSADLMMDAERFVIGAESLRALTAKRAKVSSI